MTSDTLLAAAAESATSEDAGSSVNSDGLATAWDQCHYLKKYIFDAKNGKQIKQKIGSVFACGAMDRIPPMVKFIYVEKNDLFIFNNYSNMMTLSNKIIGIVSDCH
jgi:hypothetical protein